LTKPSTDRPWGFVFLLAGLPATFSAMVLPFNPALALPWVVVSWPVTAYAGYRIWRASHPPASASTAIATRVRTVPRSASSSQAGEIADALQAFLDDPDGRQFVIFEDGDGFYLQFTMSASDAISALYGEVVSNTHLPSDRRLDAGPDAERQRELVALGWTAPPSSGDNFLATWNAPIDIDRVVTFVEATARIYGVDPGLLSPDFGSPPPLKGP
jgi:hypothetical protein